MKIEPIRYMEWAKLRSKARRNLTRSGVEDILFRDLNGGRENLEINGENSYGYPPLLEAIARRYGVSEENVITTNGASQGIFCVCAALLERGDRVLVEKPAYEPLLSVPRFFEAGVLRLERKFEKRYQVDLKELASLLSSPVKLIFLTNLHNPTGVLIKRADLRKLALLARDKGALVVVDEIYLEFLKGEDSRTSFGLTENIIVISSLTKVYGLGGLRCGWILAPTWLTEKLRRLIDYLIVEGAFIAEQISAASFPKLARLGEENQPVLEQNRQLVKEFIQEESRLSWVEPDEGVICFPRIEASLNGDQLASLLRERHQTSVVPGSFFEEPQHFRLGFGVKPDVLAEGLAGIREILSEY